MKEYRFLLFLIAFGFAHEAFALMAGYWQRETKNATQFIDGPDPSIVLKDGTSLAMPDEWYFYKDHIVGALGRDQEATYFVIDELNSEVSIFDQEEIWQAFINSHGLKPLLWARWYTGDWNKMTAAIYLLAFIFPITIGWLLLHIRWIIQVRKTGARKYYVYFSILPMLLLITYLFSQFPGSV